MLDAKQVVARRSVLGHREGEILFICAEGDIRAIRTAIDEKGEYILPDNHDWVSPSLEVGGFSEYVLNQTLPPPSQFAMSVPEGALAM